MLINLGIPYDSVDALVVGSDGHGGGGLLEPRDVHGAGDPGGWFRPSRIPSFRRAGCRRPAGVSILRRGAILSDAPTFDWSLLARLVAQNGYAQCHDDDDRAHGLHQHHRRRLQWHRAGLRAGLTRKNVLDADELPEVNPLFEKIASREGFYSPGLVRRIAQPAAPTTIRMCRPSTSASRRRTTSPANGISACRRLFSSGPITPSLRQSISPTPPDRKTSRTPT